MGETPCHGTLGSIRTESWLEWSSGTFRSFTKANHFLLQVAQTCSGPGGHLGRPGDFRAPFHLRAICVGSVQPRVWGPSVLQGQAGLHPQSLRASGPQSPAHTVGGAAGAGMRAPSSCTHRLCKAPSPRDPL